MPPAADDAAAEKAASRAASAQAAKLELDAAQSSVDSAKKEAGDAKEATQEDDPVADAAVTKAEADLKAVKDKQAATAAAQAKEDADEAAAAEAAAAADAEASAKAEKDAAAAAEEEAKKPHPAVLSSDRLQLEKAFLQFNKDKSGFLDRDEMREVLCMMVRNVAKLPFHPSPTIVTSSYILTPFHTTQPALSTVPRAGQ